MRVEQLTSSPRPSPYCPLTGQDQAGLGLELENVYCRYSRHDVLRGFSLRVAPGRICGLLGPNGSGKTTLFKCCMNFIKTNAGKIRMNGVETAGLKPLAMSRIVAYVPQESRQVFPFTVREVVRMGRTPHMPGFFRLSRQDMEIADHALERTGLTHLADQPCFTLSGGQRQLVMIARAVAQNTPLMLLDEPTSALDFQNQLDVWAILRQIAASGVTIVAACHDPNLILWYCDQAAIISQGKTLFSGPPRATLSTENMAAIYGQACSQTTLNGLPIIHPNI